MSRANLLFRTGKNKKGRFVASPGTHGGPRVVRYYPQLHLSDFNAAILGELGVPARKRMIDVMGQYTAVEGGWRKDTATSGGRSDVKPKKRPGGKRPVPGAAAQRINALRRRLLRIGDAEGAEECRKAIEELRRPDD